MSLASAFGFGTTKVRYAVVGAGDITQSAMLPGIKHTGNSELTAIVTGDAEKGVRSPKDTASNMSIPIMNSTSC